MKRTKRKAPAGKLWPSREAIAGAAKNLGNAGSTGNTCVCGHAIEEHGHDPKYPGSTACGADGSDPDAPGDGCDCIAYESEG